MFSKMEQVCKVYADGGHLVQQRRKTRVNDGTLLNIVEANDGALPLQC